MYNWIRHEPSIPMRCDHWGQTSHAHIIHGLLSRFYCTIVNSHTRVNWFPFASSCLFLFFQIEPNLAHEAGAAFGVTSSNGGKGTRILTTHILGLRGDTGDEGLAGDVPHGDVLVHAVGQIGLLLGGEGGTGVRDTCFETVLVDFLVAISVLLELYRYRGGDVRRSGNGHCSWRLPVESDA